MRRPKKTVANKFRVGADSWSLFFYRTSLLVLFLLVPWQLQAVLPPEKLLPKETLFVVTVPEASKSWGLFTNSAYGRLWNDPAMKPFTDNVMAKLQGERLGPLEQQLGVQLSAYKEFAQGQLTYALLRNEPGAGPFLSQILLVDVKDKSDKLKAALEDVKRKWVDAGKPLKTEPIRGIDFTTFITTGGEISNTWSRLFVSAKPKAPADAQEDSEEPPSQNPDAVEITVGQSGSLLLISDSSRAIEKILSRQAGGLIAPLEEEPSFQADYLARLRGAPAYAWVNAKGLMDSLIQENKARAVDGEPAPMGNFEKLSTQFGLADLKTAALIWRDTPDGFTTQLFLGAPENSRRGIFRLLVPEAKDSSPPPFVPADAVKFIRWRLDLAQGWNTLESMLGEMNPSMRGLVSFFLEAAGKDKDEKYDLKTELMGSLGNDLISVQKRSRPGSAANATPTLYLIGSPKPEKLAFALKVGLGAFNQGIEVRDAEFLGRKLYTLLPRGEAENNNPETLRFAAGGSYVAFSTDTALLEEYLRSAENRAKSLAEMPGLIDAAQKVGGMGSGFFGFSDQREALRVTLDDLHKNSGKAPEALGASRFVPASFKGVSSWADYSLLPPFEQISKYFYYTVYAAKAGPDGVTLTYFAPTPPHGKTAE